MRKQGRKQLLAVACCVVLAISGYAVAFAIASGHGNGADTTDRSQGEQQAVRFETIDGETYCFDASGQSSKAHS